MKNILTNTVWILFLVAGSVAGVLVVTDVATSDMAGPILVHEEVVKWDTSLSESLDEGREVFLSLVGDKLDAHTQRKPEGYFYKSFAGQNRETLEGFITLAETEQIQQLSTAISSQRETNLANKPELSAARSFLASIHLSIHDYAMPACWLAIAILAIILCTPARLNPPRFMLERTN